MKTKLTDLQASVIRCALADLSGALRAYQQLDLHVHDWRAHAVTIDELIDAFPSLRLLETV